MKLDKGITLVALVITIILLLILAGVTMNDVRDGGILGNTEKAVDMSKVSSVQDKIKMAIAKKMLVSDRSVDLQDIIEQLEKQGIVKNGDSNVEIGQVKTQPDGYVFEIKEKVNGNWEVTYVGNGDIVVPEVIITLSKNTTGLTDEVIITMTAKSDSGIASYILPEGISQSVISGTNEITKTYTATKNGTYEFVVVNGNGNNVTKSITVNNILENEIEISVNKTMPTTDDVIVTIKWPSDASKGVKQIQVGEGVLQTVTGAISQITVRQNCTITARVTNSIGEISSASLSIGNIDKTLPTVIATEGTDIIDWRTDAEISSYFTVVANGTMDITSIEYIDTSNGNTEVENTNTLTVGTHIIQCIAIKETGAMSSTTKTIVVEPNVYGNLYKISDAEYHLIFNTTGDIAEGYTESQLAAKGTNIKNGSGYTTNSEGENISNQPWGAYSENITKVKIEEEIKPKSTEHYFRNLSQITEIEGLYNLDTSSVTNMWCMFAGCYNLINLDVSNWNTSNVINMCDLFVNCHSLTSIDVSNWDTGKVENMQGVFGYCYNLESVNVSAWNTSNVVTMESTFLSCRNLTSIDVSEWDTGKVENMCTIFAYCEKLEKIDVSKWNTGSVRDMFGVFMNCLKLTSIALSKWDTSNVTNMEAIFLGCASLVSVNVSDWNTEKVETMHRLFSECISLTNVDVSKWKTSCVTNLDGTFYNCEELTNLDLSGWDTNKVTTLEGMFANCLKLASIDVSGWNTQNVENMLNLFARCYKLTSLDLSSWDTSKVTNMSCMFDGANGLTKIYVGDKWSTTAVTSSISMFYNCTSLSGAIVFNSSKIDATYANYTNGYLTYKANQ